MIPLACTLQEAGLALALLILAVVALGTIEMMRGTRGLRLLREIVPPDDRAWPPVSVIVPACNEERQVELALRSLLQQDYPSMEIIVVDDRSTDRTGEILDRLAGEFRQLKVLHVTELPAGWLGKNHAVHRAAQQATGQWLLFTDADVVMEPGSLRRAMSYAIENRCDHLAIAPSIHMHGTLLNMAASAFVIFFGFYAKPWKARDPRSSCHLGIGAFNLVRREAYEAIGTHRAIALCPVDDMKLGKLIKQRGFRQDVLLGQGMLSVEWYASFRELRNGLVKNSYAGLEYRFSALIAGTLVVGLLYVWPLVGLLVTGGWTQLAYALATGAAILACWDQSRYMGFNPRYAPLLPFSTLLFLHILWSCTLQTLREGSITWRGTRYSLDELRANNR